MLLASHEPRQTQANDQAASLFNVQRPYPMTLKKCLFSLTLLLPSLLAQAQDYALGDLQITQPWSREMPPVAPTAATYLTVHNRGSEDDRLIGASTTSAGRAELHEHRHADGLMKMQQVAAIELPAGSEIRLAPMGYHVMLFELARQAKDGERFPLTLQFEKAGELTIEVPVMKQPPAAKGHPGH